jgi:hypothetical protein
MPRLLADGERSAGYEDAMKIRYELTIKDMVAFGDNVCFHSPTVRRKRHISAIFAGIFVLVAMAAIGIILHSVVFLIGAVVGPPIAMAMASSLFRDRVQASFRRIYSEKANKRLLGSRELELTDTSIRAKTQLSESSVQLDALE